MIRFLSLLFLLLLACAVPAQAPAKGVKTMTTHAAGWSDKGDSTVKFLTSATEYDTKGRTVKSENFRRNDFSPTPTDSSSAVYYSYRGGLYGTTPAQLEEFRYDARDSIVLEKRYGPSFFMVPEEQDAYTYRADGKLQEITTTESGKISCRQVYTYNAAGKCIQKKYVVLDYLQYSTTTYYHYDATGNLTSSGSRNAKGVKKDSAFYRYDAKNRRVLGMKWKGARLEDSTVTIFHEKGKTKIQYRPFFWSGDTPGAWKHEVTEYDLAGNILLRVKKEYKITDLREMAATPVNEIDSTIYVYWPGGKLKSVTETEYRNGTVRPATVNTYNENGDPLEELWYDRTGLNHGTRRAYDSNGRLVKETHFGYGWQNNYRLFFYDAKGMLLEEWVYTPGGRLLEKYYHSYTFFP
jgi:antitoxin component YwqK of YwqJK toxin-antitoxin module